MPLFLCLSFGDVFRRWFFPLLSRSKSIDVMIAKFECYVSLLCVRSVRPYLVSCDLRGSGKFGLVQPRQCLFNHPD